MVLLKVLL